MMLVGIFVMMSFQSISADVMELETPVLTDQEESPTDEQYKISFDSNIGLVVIYLRKGTTYISALPGDSWYIEAGTWELSCSIVPDYRKFAWWVGKPIENVGIWDNDARETYVSISGPGSIMLWTHRKDDVSIMLPLSSPSFYNSLPTTTTGIISGSGSL